MGAAIVIAGAGQAGFQTAAALREGGWEGRVVVVGDEPGLPYQRPPLSKGFLAGKVSADGVVLRPEAFYERHRIELIAGRAVTEIDRAARTVRLSGGAALVYAHLVLATGARARALPVPGADADGVVSLRTLADAVDLAARLRGASRAVVVGGGFIGLEFAAVATEAGVDVTVLEALPRLLARAGSAPLSRFYLEAHAEFGARVLLGSTVTRVVVEGGRAVGVETADGERHAADVVVVAVGIVPNVDLAAACGLAVDDGVVVDGELLTSDPHISAIGDCARYPSRLTGATVRLESVQNAVDHARCVASRLTGERAPYAAVPWFWSDQRALKLQIAGLTAGHDATVVTGSVAERRFSVFCFAGSRLLGVESVNRPADHISARRLFGGELVGALTPDVVGSDGFDLKSFLARQS